MAMLMAAIAEAQESLKLYFYIFEHDETGRSIMDALAKAAARGVAVSVLVDGFGTEDIPRADFQWVEEAGIHFDRFIPRWSRRYLLRNHQKMLIADDRIALVGGSNIADDYFDDRPHGTGWHDLMLRVEGPAAGRLGHYYDGLARWIRAPRPRIRGLISLLARHSEDFGAICWQMGGPFRRLNPLTRSLKRAIDKGSSIDMIQAYFSPNWGFLRKLGRSARRGHTRIITAQKSDNVTTISAARHCYRRLLLNGAHIYEYRPQKLHAKLVVVDDAVWIGSANFDMRSLYLNTEIMLRVQDAGFAAAVRQLVDAHLPHCETISADSHRRNSPPWARLIRLLSYFIVSTVDFRLSRGFNLRKR